MVGTSGTKSVMPVQAVSATMMRKASVMMMTMWVKSSSSVMPETKMELMNKVEIMVVVVKSSRPR